MKSCIIFLALCCFLGTVCGEPKKSCLACPNEQSLWPICAIEFRINQISVKTFETVCKMNLYNCVNDRRFIELFAGACEGPNINTKAALS